MISEGIPIINIVIAVILLTLALIAVRIRLKRKEKKSEQPVIRNKKAFLVQWLIGLILALTGAFFMFDGDILGENTTGIATVIGIVGIGLISTSNLISIASNTRNKNH